MRDIYSIITSSKAPALTDPHLQAAEELVFLIHEGVDWGVWGGNRRNRYWEALADRVRAGTYAGPSLSDWWEAVCYHIESTPRDATHREKVAQVLYNSDLNQRKVLKHLREDASVLVLRIRVHLESYREKEEITYE